MPKNTLSQEDKLFNLPCELVLWSSIKVDKLLITCGENLYLYLTGFTTKTIDQMDSKNQFLLYEIDKNNFLKQKLLTENQLIQNALNLIRSND